MGHASADDMRKNIEVNAKAAAETPTDDPRHELYHQCINSVLDQMDREGGPSYGQEK